MLTPNVAVTKAQIIDRVRGLVPRFRWRAAQAEETRELPKESASEMLNVGLARILMPVGFGGYGLGFDSWFDVVREISKADASHGWCASLIIHHAHCVAQFPEEAQRAVWAGGPDVAVAASFMPLIQVRPVDGGYTISGKSPFTSGVGHSGWAFIGGMVDNGPKPEWTFFLMPRDDFSVEDTWHTVGMRGTGSNTIVTENVFVPVERTLRLTELRDGNGPGSLLHESPIFHKPFAAYAPLTFAATLLGTTQGAYEHFRDWTKSRKGPGGTSVAERTSIQTQLARTAADIDAAELLLRRTIEVAEAATSPSFELRARSMRDYSRATEFLVCAIDSLMSMSGTAGFATSHPLQRAWRDIHFASMHVSLNPEKAYSHFGRVEFGLPPDGQLIYF